jgi:hypothetical protein
VVRATAGASLHEPARSEILESLADAARELQECLQQEELE